MNWVLDIATVAILVIGACVGRKRGFVRSLAGIIVLIAAIFGASLIAEKLAAPVTNWLQPMVQDAVWEKIQGNVSVKLSNLPQAVQNMASGAVAAGETAAVAAVKSVVYNVVRTVLYIVGFIVLRFVLTVFVRPLTKLFNNIPVVGGINKLLGGIIGLLGGVLVIYVAIWVLQSINLLKPEAIASTRVLVFFAQHSLVELFNRLLSVKDDVAAFIGNLKK